MWTLAFGYHEDRTPTHGYEPMREAANGGVRQELTAGVVQWKPKTEIEATGVLPPLKTARLHLNGKTARSWRGTFSFTHLARGGMTVTIGRRELLAALGGAAAWPLTAHNDDRAAIVAALADNQGRQLRVPPGRYRVSAPILLPNGIHIRGDAHDGSSFQGGALHSSRHSATTSSLSVVAAALMTAATSNWRILASMVGGGCFFPKIVHLHVTDCSFAAHQCLIVPECWTSMFSNLTFGPGPARSRSGRARH